MWRCNCEKNEHKQVLTSFEHGMIVDARTIEYSHSNGASVIYLSKSGKCMLRTCEAGFIVSYLIRLMVQEISPLDCEQLTHFCLVRMDIFPTISNRRFSLEQHHLFYYVHFGTHDDW